MKVFILSITVLVIGSLAFCLVLTFHNRDVVQKGVTRSSSGLTSGAAPTSLHRQGRRSEPRHEEAKSPGEVVAALQKRGLDVCKVPDKDLTLDGLAGHYSKFSLLAGSEYYLFSDGTYLYTCWADIMPETIYDWGKWTVKDGCVHLISDGSLPSDSMQPEDHLFVPMLLANSSHMRLIGWPRQFSRWFGTTDGSAKDSKADAAISFGFGSIMRKATLSRAAQETLRKELMGRAWRRGGSADKESKK
jgi:hypothetical protein